MTSDGGGGGEGTLVPTLYVLQLQDGRQIREQKYAVLAQ